MAAHTVDQRILEIVPAPDGRVRCSLCKTFKLPSEFYGQKRWCKECRKSDEKRRRKDPRLIRRYRHRYANDRRFRAAEMLDNVKKRAKYAGFEFDLDLAWFVSRLENGTCEITGLHFDFSATGHSRQAFGPSVDRIRPGGGYTKQNCRVVLIAVNTAMMNWGLEPFIAIAKAIAARYSVPDVPPSTEDQNAPAQRSLFP